MLSALGLLVSKFDFLLKKIEMIYTTVSFNLYVL